MDNPFQALQLLTLKEVKTKSKICTTIYRRNPRNNNFLILFYKKVLHKKKDLNDFLYHCFSLFYFLFAEFRS